MLQWLATIITDSFIGKAFEFVKLWLAGENSRLKGEVETLKEISDVADEQVKNAVNAPSDTALLNRLRDDKQQI